ncbi:MAG: YkgJ family cysteine cluster protein [Desulfobacterales bacterium]|jgi:Fe-S-cluster containining protein
MDADIKEVLPDRPFSFSCGPSVSCFNRCCRDLNQFLTPYDLLRLKQGLGLSSGEFLARYGSVHDGPETGLPVVSFRTDATDGHRCPLVSEQGCRAYADRPSSCRSYPLMRLAARSRETGRISERFFLLKERHCRGFETGRPRTVRQWIVEQGLTVYNEMNDCILELISLKNRRRPGPLDPDARQRFVMALYDLDEFRRQVFAPTLSGDERYSPALRREAENDDTALLKLAVEWVKGELFP